jgi:hypothetical protein
MGMPQLVVAAVLFEGRSKSEVVAPVLLRRRFSGRSSYFDLKKWVLAGWGPVGCRSGLLLIL